MSLDVSCAKRREIILDGLTAASMRQIFAPETSSDITGTNNSLSLQTITCIHLTRISV
jgi:hypothetical protein